MNGKKSKQSLEFPWGICTEEGWQDYCGNKALQNPDGNTNQPQLAKYVSSKALLDVFFLLLHETQGYKTFQLATA